MKRKYNVRGNGNNNTKKFVKNLICFQQYVLIFFLNRSDRVVFIKFAQSNCLSCFLFYARQQKQNPLRRGIFNEVLSWKRKILFAQQNFIKPCNPCRLRRYVLFYCFFSSETRFYKSHSTFHQSSFQTRYFYCYERLNLMLNIFNINKAN